ncbi:MAG: radical SAM protein [Kibdelosporangium sp.]
MKVALAVPSDPPGVNNFNQVPIGALYTAAQLRDHGVDVVFRDLRRGATDEDYRALASSDLAVVFSTDYDLAQCYPSLRPAAECVRRLRAAGPAPVVCAGSHAAAAPVMTGSFTGADSVVAGEFEFAVPALVAHLAGGGALPPVWPPNGQPVMATEADLAKLTTPAYDLAPIREYASEGFVDGNLRRVRSGLVLANRGCPFGCSFCYLFFGKRLRRRPIDSTLAELTTLHHDYGIEHFFFLDYTFTLDRAWVRELCAEIQATGLDIGWICQTRIDCLDDELLRLMRASGCTGIWLGVESPELDQRRYLGKGRIGFDAIQDGVALVRRAGIEVLAFVMVGLPNETESSLRSLNDWLAESDVYYSLSTFQRRIGTPLAAESGALPQDWSCLDARSEYLGESRLRVADLDWFHAYHASSRRLVANVMRGQVVS